MKWIHGVTACIYQGSDEIWTNSSHSVPHARSRDLSLLLKTELCHSEIVSILIMVILYQFDWNIQKHITVFLRNTQATCEGILESHQKDAPNDKTEISSIFISVTRLISRILVEWSRVSQDVRRSRWWAEQSWEHGKFNSTSRSTRLIMMQIFAKSNYHSLSFVTCQIRCNIFSLAHSLSMSSKINNISIESYIIRCFFNLSFLR